MLNIGKIGAKGTLKEVRVVPRLGTYIVEVVMQLPEGRIDKVTGEPKRIIGIDLGG